MNTCNNLPWEISAKNQQGNFFLYILVLPLQERKRKRRKGDGWNPRRFRFNETCLVCVLGSFQKHRKFIRINKGSSIFKGCSLYALLVMVSPMKDYLMHPCWLYIYFKFYNVYFFWSLQQSFRISESNIIMSPLMFLLISFPGSVWI